jgi:L-threonylcarbamoyladenylate synthase
MPYVTLDQLIQRGQAGDLISFPTDTVPALAAQPDHADAVYVAKQRSLDKPLILMAATAADLWQYTTGTAAEQATWQSMADRYWPGAITFVLPASEKLPPQINPAGTQTVGLRIPDHAIARHIMAETGALATTSINRSGQPPLKKAAEIEAQFPEVSLLSAADADSLMAQLDPEAYLAESAELASGVPSTVVQWLEGQWQILRQGAVKFEADT